MTHFHSKYPIKARLELDADTRNYSNDFWAPAKQEITVSQKGDNRKEIENKDCSLYFVVEKMGGVKNMG